MIGDNGGNSGFKGIVAIFQRADLINNDDGVCYIVGGRAALHILKGLLILGGQKAGLFKGSRRQTEAVVRFFTGCFGHFLKIHIEIGSVRQDGERTRFDYIGRDIFHCIFQRLSTVAGESFFFTFPKRQRFRQTFRRNFTFFVQRSDTVRFSYPFLKVIYYRGPFAPCNTLIGNNTYS